MKVIIAGEEMGVTEELSYVLKQETEIEVCAYAPSVPDLLRLTDELRPDAVFVDIDVLEIEGMQAARMLAGTADAPLIVLISAHEKYAMDAFELNAADYLLKPIAHIRLKETLRRLQDRLIPGKSPRGTLLNLLVNVGDKTVVIAPDSILAIIKEEKNVIIHTKEGKSYTSKFTLQELEEKLSAFPFFRPHRSYLVNLNEVEELIPWFNGAYNIKLRSASDLKVPVSRDSAKELFKRLSGE